MKKSFNLIFLIFVLLTSFVVFFPKEKLFYLLQEKLLAYNVTLETKSVTSNALSLDVQNLDILLAGSQIATLQTLHLSLFGIKASDIKAVGVFANKIPNVQTADIHFGVAEVGSVKGNFGTLLVSINIFKRKIVLEAKVNANIKNKYRMIFTQFKKVGDKYVYEYSF